MIVSSCRCQFAGSSSSHKSPSTRRWARSLRSLRQPVEGNVTVIGLSRALLVPGHGDVQRDRAYLQLTRTLANIRERAAAAVAKGQDLEAMRKGLDTSAFEPARKVLFKGWWLEPITRSAAAITSLQNRCLWGIPR